MALNELVVVCVYVYMYEHEKKIFNGHLQVKIRVCLRELIPAT